MDPEVLGDLLDGHTGLAVTGDPHDIVAELLGIGLGHSDILPAHHHGKPTQMSPISAADPNLVAAQPLIEGDSAFEQGGVQSLVLDGVGEFACFLDRFDCLLDHQAPVPVVGLPTYEFVEDAECAR